MKKLRTSRRRFLKLAAGASVGCTIRIALSTWSSRLMRRRRPWAMGGSPSRSTPRCACASRGRVGPHRTPSTPGPNSFVLKSHAKQEIKGPLGKGTRLHLIGESDTPHLQKTVVIELYRDYPGFALYQVSYRNLGTEPLAIQKWTQLALTVPHETAGSEPVFWSFCGSTHSDRRDWVQPVRAGFNQENFMGMEASDYGGGTPIVDVWRRDGGLAIGHIETTPRLVSLPLTCGESELQLSMTATAKHTLKAGDELVLPQAFVATHSGDYFAVLDAYRRIMAVRGIASPQPPKAAYDAVWCAWGYERDCTMQLIVDTLPKVRELGLKWAVIDDGWQTNVGDWKVSTARYPGGEADMRNLVKTIQFLRTGSAFVVGPAGGGPWRGSAARPH